MKRGETDSERRIVGGWRSAINPRSTAIVRHKLGAAASAVKTRSPAIFQKRHVLYISLSAR